LTTVSCPCSAAHESGALPFAFEVNINVIAYY
jgi:hypothetical protein